MHLVVASQDRPSFGCLTAAPLQTGLFGDAPSRLANPWFPVRTTRANGKRDPWLADSCETIWQSWRFSVVHLWEYWRATKEAHRQRRRGEPKFET